METTPATTRDARVMTIGNASWEQLTMGNIISSEYDKVTKAPPLSRCCGRHSLQPRERCQGASR